ncbi:MAG TPA: cytochrome c biogenesis protein CcsA [Polyangiaceae bacterium]|nr:cytochrome c biogenesis protein CcsA [Polyangiaceae bacterium]
MQDLVNIAFYLGVIAYSAATTLFFLDLARRERSTAVSVWAPRVLGAGALVHALHVVSASLLSRICPVESLHFALSLTALITAGVFLAVRRRSRVHAMGAFVAPLSLTFLVAAQFISYQEPTREIPRALLAVHVTANLSGVGLFLLAGAAGAFYLIQERRLKAKRLGALGGKMPALDSLDRTEHRLLLAGFPLLTLGIVTGAAFASQLTQASSAEWLRALLSYTTWLLVAAVLVLRALAGWRGRRAAYGTIAGAVCVLLVIVIYAVRPTVGAGL